MIVTIMAKKQNYLCVDLTTHMKQDDLHVLDSRRGTLFRNEEDKFTFTESGAHGQHTQPWKHWALIERSKNGKVSANDSHIKVEFYFHHEDYTDGRDLADQLATQIEQIGETLCDTDLEKMVVSIRELKDQKSKN